MLRRGSIESLSKRRGVPSVKVECENGELYYADHLICALPIGGSHHRGCRLEARGRAQHGVLSSLTEGEWPGQTLYCDGRSVPHFSGPYPQPT
jgi:hypothetical protein